MKTTLLAAACLAALSVHPVAAHFQELLPSTNILEGEKQRTLSIQAVFTHPMEGAPTMDMGTPVQFGVIGREGERSDLSKTLKPMKSQGKQAFSTTYTVSGPANYIFYIEPAPYYEPVEKKMLIHYTKTVVNAFGADDGWDQLTGAPVEIRPLTRPFGLWAGNSFTGIVLRDGKPSPFTRIEIEYKNDAHIKAPSDPYVTAVIKSDANGYFSYAMPKAGWWGFAALITGEKHMAGPGGESLPVEEGGLMWVRTVDFR